MKNADGFSLEDLDPRGVTIQIKVGDKLKDFHLKKFSIAAQLWVKRTFGDPDTFLQYLDPNSEINEKEDGFPYLETVLKTTHFLMEDDGKNFFRDWGHLSEFIAGPVELLQLQKALVVTMGLSQPIVDEMDREFKKKLKEVLTAELAGI